MKRATRSASLRLLKYSDACRYFAYTRPTRMKRQLTARRTWRSLVADAPQSTQPRHGPGRAGLPGSLVSLLLRHLLYRSRNGRRTMLRTRVCELLGIRHPIALGGMSTGTRPELVAAVSNASGLGIQGASGRPPADVSTLVERVRELTHHTFGLNLLLFMKATTNRSRLCFARGPPYSRRPGGGQTRICACCSVGPTTVTPT